jgi:hypothetical protein
MNQALYAHMNNKRKMKKKKRIFSWKTLRVNKHVLVFSMQTKVSSQTFFPSAFSPSTPLSNLSMKRHDVGVRFHINKHTSKIQSLSKTWLESQKTNVQSFFKLNPFSYYIK